MITSTFFYLTALITATLICHHEIAQVSCSPGGRKPEGGKRAPLAYDAVQFSTVETKSTSANGKIVRKNPTSTGRRPMTNQKRARKNKDLESAVIDDEILDLVSEALLELKDVRINIPSSPVGAAGIQDQYPKSTVEGRATTPDSHLFYSPSISNQASRNNQFLGLDNFIGSLRNADRELDPDISALKKKENKRKANDDKLDEILPMFPQVRRKPRTAFHMYPQIKKCDEAKISTGSEASLPQQTLHDAKHIDNDGDQQQQVQCSAQDFDMLYDDRNPNPSAIGERIELTPSTPADISKKPGSRFFAFLQFPQQKPQKSEDEAIHKSIPILENNFNPSVPEPSLPIEFSSGEVHVDGKPLYDAAKQFQRPTDEVMSQEHKEAQRQSPEKEQIELSHDQAQQAPQNNYVNNQSSVEVDLIDSGRLNLIAYIVEIARNNRLKKFNFTEFLTSADGTCKVNYLTILLVLVYKRASVIKNRELAMDMLQTLLKALPSTEISSKTILPAEFHYLIYVTSIVQDNELYNKLLTKLPGQIQGQVVGANDKDGLIVKESERLQFGQAYKFISDDDQSVMAKCLIMSHTRFIYNFVEEVNMNLKIIGNCFPVPNPQVKRARITGIPCNEINNNIERRARYTFPNLENKQLELVFDCRL